MVTLFDYYIAENMITFSEYIPLMLIILLIC